MLAFIFIGILVCSFHVLFLSGFRYRVMLASQNEEGRISSFFKDSEKDKCPFFFKNLVEFTSEDWSQAFLN